MKRTPLYATHVAAGARLVEFAGWEMPVQYQGILAEHRAVRERAGLFDVSHMGQIEVRGAAALAALQRVTANDLTRLSDGSAQYSLLMLPSGGIVDDIIVHRFSSSHYFLCVNAANREGDVEYLRQHAAGAEIVDRSDDCALLALQGPRATEVLGKLTKTPLASVARFCFVDGEVAGCSAMLARTGYTGEDGWELYCRPTDAPALWDVLLVAGTRWDVVPVGLGARDTLRLEAALPLYGHELTRETTPYEARLGWVVRLEKGDFLGRDALVRQKEEGLSRILAGLRVDRGGVPRQGYAILHAGGRVGEVCSGTQSPTLGKGIALGYVEPHLAKNGTRLGVEVRGREVDAEVVATPFYRRPSQRK
jgi:aminomethyltransferase